MKKVQITILTVLTGSSFVFSQIEQETIDVEKSYNPAVQDVEKLDESPVFDNEVEKNKLEVNYSPINIPVKSDYKLSSINPVKLPIKDNNTLYNSYLKGGLGLPMTTLLDAYVDYEYDRNKHFGAFLHHFGTDSDVDGVRVDDDQSQNSLELFYKANYDDLATKLTLGYDVSTYNYYGIGDLNSVFGTNTADQIYNTVETENNYHTAYLNFGLDGYENRIFDNSDLLVRYFKGDFNADEIYARLDTDLAHDGKRRSMPLNSIYFRGNANLNLEYIHTDFNESTFGSNTKAGFFKATLEPTMTITNDVNYIKLGFDLTYNNDYENNQNDVYIYPEIEAMIRPADEFNIYAGVNGGLKNNTYYDLVQSNPWMAPGIALKSTNTRYNIYGGIKGVFNDVFQYKGEISYADIDDFMMMANVPIEISTTIPTYRLENSFGTVYGDTKNLAVKGELNYVGIDRLTTTLAAAFYNYDVEGNNEAWNYPDFTSTFTAEYKLLDNKLAVGTDIYYIGERKDLVYDYTTGSAVSNGRKTLNSYVDANLRGNYNINDKWGAFLKLNNIFGDYEKFKNYDTQGFQILGGFTYKFSVNR
ncbi:hypothetical protein UJ101_02111 [Flavobacteriaceae bacterium UJ101]|nr:hypothetical protein UJ101_02111 [Flavobacteriaceae bacterium UJ101]